MTDIAYTVGDTAITVSYQGAQGPGVASGGTTGQVLVKSDSDDYSTEWTTLSESDIADLGAYPDATGQAADKIAQTDGVDGWTFVDSPAASTVTSVNSQTGAVVLSYSDVSAAAESHTHTESEITDLGSYETAGVAATLIATHHGASSTDHDDRYYTEAEVDSALSGKADTSHSHTLSDITDAGTAAASDTGDFATAAQGALADSATQPGDDADTLGSGTATDGQVLTADGAGGAAWGDVPATRYSINHQTGTTYTLALSDDGGIVKCDNASPFSLTVPPESSVAFTAGANIKIKAHGAGAVTVVEGAGVTVNTADTLVLDGQHAGAELVYEGSDVWWLVGRLVAA